jgi:hypothetical protein
MRRFLNGGDGGNVFNAKMIVHIIEQLIFLSMLCQHVDRSRFQGSENMTIKRFVNLSSVFGIVIVVLFVAGIAALRYSTTQTRTANQKHLEALALSRETSENSFNLTANVRSYVASGEPLFKERYFHILDVQSGKIPRPDTAEVAPGKTIELDKLYDEAGFTREEKAALSEANRLSLALADLEIAAMEEVEAAPPDKRDEAILVASKLLHDKEYLDAENAVQVPVDKFHSLLAERLARDEADIEALSFHTQILLYIVVGLTVVLVFLAILWMRRRVLITLGGVSSELHESSERVEEASAQINSSARTLAEGTTSQAASLEETSAALEQMASMTRQNADNAIRTDTTTQNNNQLIQTGSGAVSNMTGAMDQINESAERIGNIIKTIEEIAFQTNLLALNAAVEAARAGEAGKGFAVVADEVRNLAGRSAQAARDTTELIQTTIARVRHGTELARELDSGFKEIETGSRSVALLIKEIASATNEQALGVDQVNTAMAQVDKVTQANSAMSEEVAAAATQLSAQSVALNRLVDVLMEMVGRTRPKKREKQKARLSSRSQSEALLEREVKMLSHTPAQGDDF